MANITLSLPDAMRHALAAFHEGQHGAAAVLCSAVVAVKPDFFDAVYLQAVLQSMLGGDAEALAGFDRALSLRPDFASALNNRGITLHRLRRYPEALDSYDQALATRPDFAEAHNNRGLVLHRLERFDEALACYDRASTLRPGFADPLCNRGLTLTELQRFDEALACYGRALALAPDHVRARVNDALLRLLLGDLGGGFSGYEWRWRDPAVRARRPDLPQPAWRGAPIDGRTILVYGEQGFGDAIQFARYVPLLAARGARVILDVAEPLRELMTSLDGGPRVISGGAADFDTHCPLMSLPLAFATRLDTIPAASPYLRAPPAAAARWAARLGDLPRPRIGLAWAGNPNHDRDADRSIPLPALAPLLDIDASFVSLQKDLCAGDADWLRRHPQVRTCGSTLTDFADTAGLMTQLDVVVAVDTGVAHLAGALGKPVFVLLPFTPDWRWLLGRDDSPWYPTARLFRQTGTRSWGDVVARVEAALARREF